jgi:hypothetical protein
MSTYKTKIIQIINEELNKIVGGKAYDLTLDDLAKKHKVSLKSIQLQIEKGIKLELEHTKSKSIAREIAKDHIFEIPDYYDRLNKMEKDAEKEIEKKKK